MMCHHPDRSCDQKHCGSGGTIFLICQVTSPEHIFKELCEFICGISSQ